MWGVFGRVWGSFGDGCVVVVDVEGGGIRGGDEGEGGEGWG